MGLHGIKRRSAVKIPVGWKPVKNTELMKLQGKDLKMTLPQGTRVIGRIKLDDYLESGFAFHWFTSEGEIASKHKVYPGSSRRKDVDYRVYRDSAGEYHLVLASPFGTNGTFYWDDDQIKAFMVKPSKDPPQYHQ